MRIGEKIKYYRKRAGMTQQELATAVGVANTTITGYEIGNREPNAPMIIKIAHALNVTGDDLLGLDIKETPPAPAAEATKAEEVSIEELTNLLYKLGFIQEGGDLSDKDLIFLEHVTGLLDAWFSQDR